jgi:flagella basal body P-ring formation protein FlgA
VVRAELAGSAVPRGRVRVDVSIARDGERLRRVPVSLHVRVTQRVLVAARAIAEGQAFTRTNVTSAVRDVTMARDVLVTEMAELAGMVAARAVAVGQPLTRRLLREREAPVVIQRNQRVRLVVHSATLRAATLGRALGRARRGEVVRAENLSTGREVLGLAVDDGTVWIPLEGDPHGGPDVATAQ